MTYEEAIKILGNVSLDYTGMNQEEIDKMDESLTLAFNAMSILIKQRNIPDELAETMESLKKANERIQELEKELEESRAKEGKGAFETAIENFGQLFSSIPEEIRELMRPEEEEDHD